MNTNSEMIFISLPDRRRKVLIEIFTFYLSCKKGQISTETQWFLMAFIHRCRGISTSQLWHCYLCLSRQGEKFLEPVSWSTESRLTPTSYTINDPSVIVCRFVYFNYFSLRTIAWFALVHLTPTSTCSCLLLFPKWEPLVENLIINKTRKLRK